jgi:hypothetical protein
MTDLTKLKSLLYRIDNITHRKKTDEAYWQATEVATELSTEMPDDKNIKIDIKILKKYDSKGSDKKKQYVIDEFKQESMHDIVRAISSIENSLPNDL